MCSPCASECVECQGNATTCTYCDSNGTNKFLHNASCEVQCPQYHYDDTTQIPHVCQPCASPCLECSGIDTCQSCVLGYYLMNSSCILTCPDGTLPNNNTQQCDSCAVECGQCDGTIDNCTSCSGQAILHNNTCVTECPGKLILVNGGCVSCNVECDTCSQVVDNCTSCSVDYPLQHLTTCVTGCPQFYYPSNNECKECSAQGIGCNDCNGVNNCSVCDSGLIFLDFECLNSTPTGYINISGEAVPC